MMRTFYNKKNLLTGLIPAMVLLCACQKELRGDADPVPNHNLTLQFKAVVDGDSLEFGRAYQNIFNEQYAVSNFKFYLCQVDLLNTDSGKSYRLNKDDYFLVNFGNPGSTRILLKTISGTFNRIAFTIGVDSIRNVSGAQTGALDPANGMFWTWNTGYIMAKLEGNSNVSNQPNQVFEYHIGGFSGTDNVVQKVSLVFPLSSFVTFQEGRSTQLTITANANTWFSGTNPISISANPVCTTPGTLAKQFAGNYASMFDVVNLVSE